VKTFSLGTFGSVTLIDESPSSWFAPSSAEMAGVDAETIAAGVSSLELMERAGGVVVDAMREVLDTSPSAHARILVLCGAGNNGGDGLVIARRLADEGIVVNAVVTDAARYSSECIAQSTAFPYATVLEGSGEVATRVCGGRTIAQEEFTRVLGDATIVVDALLGTGQREAPRGAIATLVERVIEEKTRRPDLIVFAVDIPTGVDADTGALHTPHISADHTVSIELIKRGMMQLPGRQACGAIRVAPIEISSRRGIEFSVIEGSKVPSSTRRPADAHKGMQGRVLVIGGCAAMPGASALAVLGALRAGAGLVSRVTKPSWIGVAITPECTNVIVNDSAAYYHEGDVAAISDAISLADAIIIGPGLGRAPETGRFLQRILDSLRLHKKRVVVDADALTLIASQKIDLTGIEGVMTPHPGEAATMLGVSVADIQRDRFSAVKALFDRYHVVTLLKGAGTLVWDGREGGIIPRGTPYLATAGSGDVLSGILAASLKGCERVFDAAVRGAYIHAVAGERASALSGGPIIASDIAWSAAAVIGEFER
jgi:NAD(P)H-hydrate epimerase